jgi:4-amino-4-deoxychorismate lyase
MFWVNGQPQESISLADRSFQYGDGCFTTMLTLAGEIEHWQYHKERMQACLKTLLIPEPDWRQVEQWLKLATLNQAKAGLKLHISRGEGGRGYSPTQVGAANVTISNFAYPAHYDIWRSEALNLGVATHQLGHMPMLAGHKHNNRLEQILIKAELEQQGLADGVVLDLDHNVIETSMANLIWFKSGVLYTPNLDKAGVAGVMRRRVLELAKQESIAVKIGEYKLSELLSADELFITNSILGVAPIKQVGETTYPIGKTTKRFQEILNS